MAFLLRRSRIYGVVLFTVSLFMTEIFAEDEIKLKANVSLQGDICPAGIKFTCTVQQASKIVWYLGNSTLTSYSPPSTAINKKWNLCTISNPNSLLLEICKDGGSLSVQIGGSILNSNISLSVLVTTGAFIHSKDYKYIKCGDGYSEDTVTTNFTMACNPPTLNLTSNNTSMDNDVCEGIVKFTCEGSDLPSIQWTYDDEPLTENFTCSQNHKKMTNQRSYLNGVNCSLLSANTDNCFPKRCNFKSVCIADLDHLKLLNVSIIGCSSNKVHRSINITCHASAITHATIPPSTQVTTTTFATKSPWFHKLSFLDFLPICHVNETTGASQNMECFGIALAVVVGFIAVIICCICCCPVGLCMRKLKHDYEEKGTEEGSLLAVKDGQNNKTPACILSGLYRCCCGKRKSNYRTVRYGSASESVLREPPHLHEQSQSESEESLPDLKEQYEDVHEQSQSESEESLPDLKDQYEDVQHQKLPFKKTSPELSSKQLSQESLPDKPDSPSLEDKRKEARLLADKGDKDRAYEFSMKVFPEYHFDDLEDLGSRLQKFWFLRKNKVEGKPNMLQITVKVSNKCPLHVGKEEIATLKELMDCLQHPYLLAIHDVEYSDDKEFISFLVDIVGEGSLRDELNKVEPLQDWSEKYKPGALQHKFRTQDIATCGRHVLKAMLLLFKKGFPPLGQVHVGNIFLKNGKYVLGGYENCLLGYRASIYENINELNLLDNIDLIMFGLMIYEIATGQQMDHRYIQEKYDFFEVEDDGLKDVLQCIFSEGRRNIGNQATAISTILDHSFFKSDDEWVTESLFELTEEGCQLLSAAVAVQSGQSADVFRVTSLNMAAVLTELGEIYEVIASCENMGWRNGKGWAQVKSRVHGIGLLTAIEIPDTCPVFVKSALSSIQALLKHPWNNLLTTYDIHYLKLDQIHILVLFQKLYKDGSLKDKVHNVTCPLGPWNEKYKNNGERLSDGEIARIGCDVLNIAYRLSLIDGNKTPLKLRFLHSGNIFMDDDCCVIGGIENMLLGCRPRNYVKFRNHLQFIDAIMFGHLIFGLGSGYELSSAVPTDEEYKSLSTPVRTVLKYIFDNVSIELHKIASLDFFRLQSRNEYNLPRFIKGEVKLLLDIVRKEKPRDQDDTGGKIKHTLVKRTVRKVKDAISRDRRHF